MIWSNPSHDADGLGGEEARVAHLVVHDAVKHLLFVVTWKRRLKQTGMEKNGDVEISSLHLLRLISRLVYPY